MSINEVLKMMLSFSPASPEAMQQPHSENATKEYGELAMWKVLEQAVVKSLTQVHSVKAVITAPDRNLDPELVERKK